jgi:hypothetical protein
MTNLYLKSVNGETLKIRVVSDPILITGSTSGGTTTAVSLGGVGIYKQKVGNVLQFKGLVAGAGIILTPNSTGVTITSAVTGISGYVTSGTFNSYTGTTAPAQFASKSIFNTYTGVTNTAINNRLLTSAFNTYSGLTLTNINSRLLTSIFNAYSASTSSVLTGINNNIVFLSGQTGLKLNKTVFNAYTGSSAPVLSGAITGITVGTNLGVSRTGRVVNITFTGSSGGGAWGSISGVLSNQIDLQTALNAKVNNSLFNTYTGATQTAINSRLLTSAFNTYSGLTLTNINSRLLTSAFNTYSGATLTNINSRLLTSAFNTYSGATLTNINSRLLTSSFNTYSGATLTNINSRLLTSAFNTYSGLTNTAINNRLLTSAFNTYSGVTASRLGLIESLYLSGVTNLGSIGQTLLGVSGKNVSAKRLRARNGLAVSGTTNDVTYYITGSTGGAGTITGGTNLTGSGQGIYSAAVGANLQFKRVRVSAPLTISGGTNEVHIRFTGSTGGAGTITGGTNLGSSGQGVYSAAAGANLQFRRIRTVGNLLGVSGDTNNVSIVFTGTTGIPTNISIVGLSGNTTLDATYAGKLIQCTGTFTITLPNSMATGMQLTIVNIGTGVVTIAATGTLQSKFGNTRIASQYAAASTYHQGSNIWRLFGDLTL